MLYYLNNEVSQKFNKLTTPAFPIVVSEGAWRTCRILSTSIRCLDDKQGARAARGMKSPGRARSRS